jgi:anti-sigma B factor antagonist
MPVTTRPFRLSIDEPGGGVTVVHLAGELDIIGAPDLRACLYGLLMADQAVVVDLSALSFLDSSGMAVLASAHRQAASGRGTIVLRGAGGIVARVLEVSGVDQVLTVEAAKEGVAGQGG